MLIKDRIISPVSDGYRDIMVLVLEADRSPAYVIEGRSNHGRVVHKTWRTHCLELIDFSRSYVKGEGHSISKSDYFGHLSFLAGVFNITWSDFGRFWPWYWLLNSHEQILNLLNLGELNVRHQLWSSTITSGTSKWGQPLLLRYNHDNSSHKVFISPDGAQRPICVLNTHC